MKVLEIRKDRSLGYYAKVKDLIGKRVIYINNVNAFIKEHKVPPSAVKVHEI